MNPDDERLAVYRTSFAARCAKAARAGATPVNEPGLEGFIPDGRERRALLLITDDAAYAPFCALLATIGPAVVRVLPIASRCMSRLADDRQRWHGDGSSTAMVHRDLRAIDNLPLPEGLTICPVARLDHDRPGVELPDVVTAAVRADPTLPSDQARIVTQLQTLPPSTQLFAALDDHSVIRATSGSDHYGEYASVTFVTTDSDWRRQGVAAAMTAHALRAARSHGASKACLESSNAGVSVYRRLGFEAISSIGIFMRLS